MTAALEVRGLRKSYIDGVPVLDGVDLAVPAGQVTALVGANGSGKSTLVKVLSGYHRPDPGGRVLIGGREVAEVTPELLRSAGVRFVHQDPTILPGISVLENLAVGGYQTRAGRVRWRAEREQTTTLLAQWGIQARPEDDAARLPAATLAKLALLKALRLRPGDQPVRAIVLDEPTAALGPDDAAELLGWLRTATRRQDLGALFISHRVDEILRFADRVAVLRSGRIVAEQTTEGLDDAELVERIVGAPLKTYYPARDAVAESATVFEVVGAGGRGVRRFDLAVRAGEVVGVTGLPGSGFEDLPLVLVDPSCATGGTASIDGAAFSLANTPIAERGRRGLVLVPADRKRTALATELSVRENIALPRLRSFRSGMLHSLGRERQDAEALIERFRVSPASVHPATNRLSGGNQQKVVLAKWLSTRPRVLIVHEPTQAVDIGAKSEIFAVLGEVAASGVAVVIVSVEHEDLAGLCDRVLVMGGGAVITELPREGLTGTAVAAACFLGRAA